MELSVRLIVVISLGFLDVLGKDRHLVLSKFSKDPVHFLLAHRADTRLCPYCRQNWDFQNNSFDALAFFRSENI